MIIIGVDFHPEFQQIALLNTTTGEVEEKRLAHPDEADSGASAHVPSPSTWLKSNFMLVSSRRDLEISERLSSPSMNTPYISVSRDTTKHLANPSTVRERRSYRGRQK